MDPLLELPVSVRAIVPSGTAHLISWLRFGLTELDQRYVPRAIAALEQVKANHLAMRAPATPEQLLDALTMIADTIQVELPEGNGLFVYVSLLGHLPAHVLKEAVLEVMRTHTYRTMPLPAELLKTEAAQRWEFSDIWLEKFCSKNLALLKARL